MANQNKADEQNNNSIGTIPFALSPAYANGDKVIDGSTEMGKELIQEATAPLTTKFDGKSLCTLTLFLENIEHQAYSSNWNDILTIPDAQGVRNNLVHYYGLVSLANVRANALTYIGKSTRNSQNSTHMYTCLTASLTKKFLQKVQRKSNSYCFGNKRTPDGPCFLMVLIQQCTKDIGLTITRIRHKLSLLDSYLASNDFDIEKLHFYVRIHQMALQSHGEEENYPELLMNLFKAYTTVDDNSFRALMDHYYDDYMDGRKDFTVDTLLEVAREGYKWRVVDNRWRVHVTE